MSFYEETIENKTLYEGIIVNVRLDDVRLSDGRPTRREVVEHPGGVAVVPIDENGCVVMVRQYRYPVSAEILEIPAGKLERGEDHYECALRELSEETGCKAGKMVYLGEMLPSPGFCEEVLYLYAATELISGESHPDDGELLSVERIPMEQLLDMIMKNEINDAKTIVGIMKAHRLMQGN